MTDTYRLRGRIEEFLYCEATLLDSWKLMEWTELFTDDGEYQIPSTDLPDGEPSDTLYLVYDDRHRLTERAKRLLKKAAHAEFPRSRLRRIIGNVMIEPKRAGEDTLRVTCSFAVFRSRLQKADIYPGHSLYDLVEDGESRFRIRRKRAVLDSDDLRDQGKVSIIL